LQRRAPAGREAVFRARERRFASVTIGYVRGHAATSCVNRLPEV